jgi:hypothetical protein
MTHHHSRLTMVIRTASAVALACICCVGASCHRAAPSAAPAATPASADTVRDAIIAGTVVDSATGGPLPGALVIVMVQGRDPLREREHVAGSLTDSAGQYALRVPHGRYDVWYFRIGWIRLRLPGVRARPATRESVVVRLPQSHIPLDPVVAPGGETKVSGIAPGDTADTSRFVTLAGTVVDSSDNHPVPGVRVIVTHVGYTTGERSVAESSTTESGRYALRVPYGRYDLEYSRIGFWIERRRNVLLSGTDPDSIVIKLRENSQYINPIWVKRSSP